MTPLLEASDNGHTDICMMLIRKGANIHHQNEVIFYSYSVCILMYTISIVTFTQKIGTPFKVYNLYVVADLPVTCYVVFRQSSIFRSLIFYFWMELHLYGMKYWRELYLADYLFLPFFPRLVVIHVSWWTDL